MLEDLYRRFGYYYDKSVSYTLKGMEGAARIAAIMDEARSMDMKSLIPEVVETLDFKKASETFPGRMC